MDASLPELSHYLYPGGIFAADPRPHRVTTVLGSCVSVCLWDRVRGVGGINHFLLPLWNGDGLPTPRYGNIAIAALIDRMLALGCSRENLRAKLFGGAAMWENPNGLLAVGERTSNWPGANRRGRHSRYRLISGVTWGADHLQPALRAAASKPVSGTSGGRCGRRMKNMDDGGAGNSRPGEGMRGERHREKYSLSYLRRYTLGLGLLWTVAIAALTVYSVLSLRERAVGEALVRGRALYELNLLYLEWSARHGRVYLPVTGDPSGGIKGQLTSLKPLNPNNRADSWEAEALVAFGQGEAEVSAPVRIDGRDYLRLMQPFRARQECLTCHGRQGYFEGDILGGLALFLPVDHLLSVARGQALATSACYLGIWLLGLAGLWLGESRLRQQIRATQRSHPLRRRVHQKLAHMAQHDLLTGLPNRDLFSDRLRLALASARRFDGRMAVAVLGLDHFSMINHSYGHATGDLVLKEVAARLTGCLRSDDTVARLGNGRFLLLFPNIRIGTICPAGAQNTEGFFASLHRERTGALSHRIARPCSVSGRWRRGERTAA
jgi:GGDEF domain-containing protein/chemotaxis receptor (MCP) glutamine deamidase CheD